ncbi:MAG: C40 family peptidase [Crocinitomicaceae bacterium]
MNKRVAIATVIFLLPQITFGQDKKIDQLEVLYSQVHFTKVLRKANKLLAIPDYDYSGMPTFYKSLATFRLLENEDWTKKNKNALSNAINLYDKFLEHSRKTTYIRAHYFEIAELKQYLIELQKKLKTQNNGTDARKIKSFLEAQLKNITPTGIKNLDDYPLNNKSEKQEPDKDLKNSDNYPSTVSKSTRGELVQYASGFIGTPYLWAGNTPKGFDCSGYVGYVFANYGIPVPRTAAALKKSAKSIDDSEARKGDLVFFKTGSKITHVGIVISDPGEPLTMIHSSSSKGIIKTAVQSSTYWSKKYAGVGRILE